MSKVFVIADPHWGHDNIINVPGRVGIFASPSEHDEHLIDRWNSVVTKRDTVYILGDLGYDKKGYVTHGIIPQLTGRIHVVAGNHDTAELAQAFVRPSGGRVHGVMIYKQAVLTHIPIHPQEMYWDINVHGHLHSNYVHKHAMNPAMGALGTAGEKDCRYICVSCEHVAFTPVELLPLLEDHRARWGTAIDKLSPLPQGRKRRH